MVTSKLVLHSHHARSYLNSIFFQQLFISETFCQKIKKLADRNVTKLFLLCFDTLFIQRAFPKHYLHNSGCGTWRKPTCLTTPATLVVAHHDILATYLESLSTLTHLDRTLSTHIVSDRYRQRSQHKLWHILSQYCNLYHCKKGRMYLV